MEQKEVRPWGIWLTVMTLVLSLLLALGSAARPAAVSCFGFGQKETRRVIPVGQTVGIKLFSRGVMVVGLADVATEAGDASPARACGLRTGDIITHIDGQQVDSIEEVQSLLQATGGETLESVSLQKSFRDEVADFLADPAFLLCGASYLINLAFVTQVDKSFLYMKDGTRVPLPRKNAPQIRTAWVEFWLGGGAS